MDLSAQATTLGLDAARAVDPARYRLGAATPRVALRPASRDEAVEAIRAAARDGLALVPWGGGVTLAREPAPPRYDVALDLAALDGIVEYDPEDLTLTAECGATLATLGAALAARGQELPLEGARGGRATLGGVLATNAGGPRRLRFGAPYDRVLGARFALGDGTLARSGGRVVKNVAGYAIHRLLCGSRGGLGVLLEASLKLLPAPERRLMLVYEGLDGAALADPARWERFPRLEPAALTVCSTAGGGYEVIVGLEDEARWVEQQAVATTQALGAAAARLEGAAVVARWQTLCDRTDAADVALGFVSAHNTPAALAPLLAHDARTPFVFHAPAGRLHVTVAPDQAAAMVVALAPHGFTLVEAPGAPTGPALPPQVAVQAVRARLRAALDPGDTLALGPRWAAGGFNFASTPEPNRR